MLAKKFRYGCPKRLGQAEEESRLRENTWRSSLTRHPAGKRRHDGITLSRMNRVLQNMFRITQGRRTIVSFGSPARFKGESYSAGAIFPLWAPSQALAGRSFFPRFNPQSQR